jgi:hypothetical protein
LGKVDVDLTVTPGIDYSRLAAGADEVGIMSYSRRLYPLKNH